MRVSTTGATFEWDPARRLMVVRLRSTGETPMADREAAARTLLQWTGERPYHVLVACDGTGVTTPGVLPFWAGVFRLARSRVLIATAGFPREQQEMLDGWAAKYGLDLRGFGAENDARAWLDA